MDKENSDRKNIADIIVAKHRNGPTDTVPLYFRKELTKFENLEMVASSWKHDGDVRSAVEASEMDEQMQGFAGFPAGKLATTPVPNLFFSELLPLVDNLAELKVILHLFWLIGKKRGELRYARLDELLRDRRLLDGLATPLNRAVKRCCATRWSVRSRAARCCTPPSNVAARPKSGT